MNVKMEPRKITDRGGFLTMPLRTNVPNPSDDSWHLTNCPECGRECWRRPLPEGFTEDMSAGRLCTMCALRKGGGSRVYKEVEEKRTARKYSIEQLNRIENKNKWYQPTKVIYHLSTSKNSIAP